jgi:anti-anti-sigma regulatory factor
MDESAFIRLLDLDGLLGDVKAFGFTRPISAASVFGMIDRELQLEAEEESRRPGFQEIEESTRVLVLDCHVVKDLSSSAIPDLLALYNKWVWAYPKWVLLGVSEDIQEVLKTTQIDGIVGLVEDEKELRELIQKALPPAQKELTPLRVMLFSCFAPDIKRTHLPRKSPRPLSVSSFHREIIDDLRWAEEQYAQGHFAKYAGMHVAIIRKELKAAGNHVGQLVEEVHQANPDVPVERIALFYVDPGDDVE